MARQNPMKRKLGAQHDTRGVDPARYLLTRVKPKLGKQKSGARGEKNERASNVLAKRKRKNVLKKKTAYEKKNAPDELRARNVALEKSRLLVKPKPKQPQLRRQNAASAGECAKRK